jgi:hypothetical protein
MFIAMLSTSPDDLCPLLAPSLLAFIGACLPLMLAVMDVATIHDPSIGSRTLRTSPVALVKT